ncbi:MAG: hypothetical protein ACK2U1_23275 [Anaerolineales bacterium]|jgi:hypothetical protein
MRNATKSVSTWFGIAAGIAGIEHGYFEILQGDSRPESLMIASMGPPCEPTEIWNACEPAMTIIPNFLVTGILAIIFGLAILIWSVAFIQRKNAGVVLILLSMALLLFGGGLFPPLIGIVGGIAGLKINKSLGDKQPGRILQLTTRLWPWPLVIFMIWVLGQWVVGYFFNDFMQQAMYFGVILILAMLPLSVMTAYAFDLQSTRR